MHGSNNEVAVLNEVLGSLSKSPAFSLFDAVTAPTPKPVPVIPIDYSGFIARMEEDEVQMLEFSEATQKQMTLTFSESVQLDEMERLLHQ